LSESEEKGVRDMGFCNITTAVDIFGLLLLSIYMHPCNIEVRNIHNQSIIECCIVYQKLKQVFTKIADLMLYFEFSDGTPEREIYYL